MAPHDELSLPRYAAVRAALAEGFPLGDVLSVEGIPAPAWDEASAAWTERIALEPETFSVYARELAAAEDRLTRKVTPIDTDVAAWVSFLAAFTPPVRAETMKKTGLRMTDVSRLVRHWGRRAQDEPEVKKRLAELRAQVERAKGAELPAIHVEPVELTPSRFAPSRAAPEESAAPSRPDTGDAELGLDQYAAVVEELQAGHAERADVLAKHGLTEGAFGERERSWNLVFQRDATARLDFGRLVAHQRAKRRERAVEATPRAPTPGARPAGARQPERRAPALTIEQYASLCTELGLWPDRAGEIVARYGLDEATKAEVDAGFRARLAVDPTLYEAWRRASQIYAAWLTQARGGGTGDVAGTADITSFVPREAMPFTQPEPPEAAGTADITSFVPREALPFHPEAPPAAPIAPLRAAPHAPPAGSGTEDITSFVPRAAFPFVRRAGPQGPVAAATPVARPEPPAAPPGSGTEDITSFVPRGALPFSRPANPVAPPAPHAAAAHPRMRLIRFDPQTGQPLAEPRWVELPPEPQGGTPGKR